MEMEKGAIHWNQCLPSVVYEMARKIVAGQGSRIHFSSV
jgi:hypothetical protein